MVFIALCSHVAYNDSYTVRGPAPVSHPPHETGGGKDTEKRSKERSTSNAFSRDDAGTTKKGHPKSRGRTSPSPARSSDSDADSTSTEGSEDSSFALGAHAAAKECHSTPPRSKALGTSRPSPRRSRGVPDPASSRDGDGPITALAGTTCPRLLTEEEKLQGWRRHRECTTVPKSELVQAYDNLITVIRLNRPEGEFQDAARKVCRALRPSSYDQPVNPKATTFAAIRAVVDTHLHPKKYPDDLSAQEVFGAGQSGFKVWKKFLQGLHPKKDVVTTSSQQLTL